MMLYSARELELEDRQSRLEAQLRERIASEGNRQPAGKLFDLWYATDFTALYWCFIITCVS